MADETQKPLLASGAKLAHYVVKGHLATGGMGEVYSAYEPDLGRDVAIKVLRAEFTKDPAVRESFRKEAQTLARLRHANIMPIHYIGTEGDLFFFVMPFIKGESLAERLAEGRYINQTEAYWFLTQAIAALHGAFKQNIIHLDIKPENFLIDEDNTILLADFGLARTLDDLFSTEGGILFGTPYYVAPEQLDGSPADHRSDIYSLGATLFHLMTGTPLCDGGTLEEILQNHISKKFPTQLLEMRNVTTGWIELIHRMTRLFPIDRFQTYEELSAALEALGPSAAPPPSPALPGDTDRDDTVVISIDSRAARHPAHSPKIEERPNRPQFIHADSWTDAYHIIMTHIGALRAHSSVVLFFFPEEDACSQEQLQEGILSLMRSRDYAFSIRLPRANLGAILPNTSMDGAHVFLTRVLGQCIQQNRWASSLKTEILDVNPDTLEEELRRYLPMPPAEPIP